LISRIYKIGWLASFQFVGVLSVNLAILNILPFPALDGGRLLFLGIEKIVGRRIKDRIEGTVHAIGMVFLLVLMGLITIRDVVRLF
jgi:regulator of sigma E protease